jgi:hypothetical protein
VVAPKSACEVKNGLPGNQEMRASALLHSSGSGPTKARVGANIDSRVYARTACSPCNPRTHLSANIFLDGTRIIGEFFLLAKQKKEEQKSTDMASASGGEFDITEVRPSRSLSVFSAAEGTSLQHESVCSFFYMICFQVVGAVVMLLCVGVGGWWPRKYAYGCVRMWVLCRENKHAASIQQCSTPRPPSPTTPSCEVLVSCVGLVGATQCTCTRGGVRLLMFVSVVGGVFAAAHRTSFNILASPPWANLAQR